MSTIWYNLVKTRINLSKIRANFLFLKTIAPNPIPVIKADAYGHGLAPVATTLAQAGAKILAVGTVDEAMVLREVPFDGEIISLLGPVTKEDYEKIVPHKIMPFIYTWEQMAYLQEYIGNDRQVSIALKFDTGMARLGFTRDDVPKLINKLKSMPHVRVKMVCSHLATADDPETREFVLAQGKKFDTICLDLHKGGLSFARVLVNSAGLLAYPELHYDGQRPGISLYGSNPFWGTKWEAKGQKLTPAMEVTAPVLSVHDLSRGQSISYGQTFTAPRDMQVALVACGYADNYSRSLSNKGWMLVHGRRAPVIGRVCMQLTAIDISHIPQTRPGDLAYVLGGQGKEKILPEELAKWWGTITYEVFCLLGQNTREYE
jgi:alanine racemase